MEIRKLRFRISGGFAGVVRGTDLHGDDLSAAERRALVSLFSNSADARDEGARDAQVYELEAETSDGARRAEFDEMHVPAGLDDLIGRLASASRPMRP